MSPSSANPGADPAPEKSVPAPPTPPAKVPGPAVPAASDVSRFEGEGGHPVGMPNPTATDGKATFRSALVARTSALGQGTSAQARRRAETFPRGGKHPRQGIPKHR
ncbi:MAG TPA: hypothetical protein VMF06_15825 [Candidatus Limnocylindria bacterium]|nr:hypothetical protein [Candidatus Limnocylindria bacterium]